MLTTKMKQLTLDGIIQFSPLQTYERAETLSVAQGLKVLEKVSPDVPHFIENSKRVRINPNSHRIKMLIEGKMICAECGIKANHIYLERHINDLLADFNFNVYGINAAGVEVLMTWDHILPKSLQGSDHAANAQCMCSECNVKKGNKISLQELVALASHERNISIVKAHADVPKLSKLENIWITILKARKDTNSIVARAKQRLKDAKKKKQTMA